MMKTKDGRIISDELLDSWADQFESGSWPKGTTRHVGRPSLAQEEETRILSFRLPVSQAQAFEEKARQRGETKSQVFRELVAAYLKA